MYKIVERIIAAIVILFTIVYVGYQVARYYSKPVSTETVYEYSVSKAVTTEGIAVRDEIPLEQEAFGVENYLFEDASRVSVGQTVAEFHRSSAGDQNIKRARELEEEIRILQEAQDGSVNNFGNTELYNRDIKEQLSALDTMSSTGRFAGVTDMRAALTSLISKKQIATGKETSFNGRIQVLQQELEGLERSTSGETVTTVTAPASGYYARSLDGYEGLLGTEIFESYRVEDYLELLNSKPPSAPKGKAGKMVLSQNWYYIIPVSVFDLDWIKVGQNVELQFEQVSELVPARVSQVVDQRDTDTAIVIFRSNRMTEELISIRSGQVIVHFQHYTGLRINTADLRFVDEQMGVYVLDDHTVKFRKVDAIYEEQSFILSKMNYNESVDTEYVRLFEQVITKGTDLYDGKVIQDY